MSREQRCPITGAPYFDVQGDGACLFRCISLYLYDSEDHHLEIRRQAVQYNINHWEEGTLYDEVQGTPFATPAEYENVMMRTSTYGTGSEMIALAMILETDIIWVSMLTVNGIITPTVEYRATVPNSIDTIALRVTNPGTLAAHITLFRGIPHCLFGEIFPDYNCSKKRLHSIEDDITNKKRRSAEKPSTSDADGRNGKKLSPKLDKKKTSGKKKVRRTLFDSDEDIERTDSETESSSTQTSQTTSKTSRKSTKRKSKRTISSSSDSDDVFLSPKKNKKTSRGGNEKTPRRSPRTPNPKTVVKSPILTPPTNFKTPKKRCNSPPVPIFPKATKSPKTPKTPKTPASSRTPKNPRTPNKTPKTPRDRGTKTPKTPQTPRTPRTPGGHDAVQSEDEIEDFGVLDVGSLLTPINRDGFSFIDLDYNASDSESVAIMGSPVSADGSDSNWWFQTDDESDKSPGNPTFDRITSPGTITSVTDSCDEDLISDGNITEIIKRPKPWVALNSTHLYRPDLKRSNHGYAAKSHMSAAKYGDEKWSELKLHKLPDRIYTCSFCKARFRDTELARYPDPNRKKLDPDFKDRTAACCQYGRIKLDPRAEFKEPDEFIKYLYTSGDEKAKEFRKNILPYNRMFSTVQFIATGLGSHRGPVSVLSVNGKVTYEPNSFNLTDKITPGQVYFCEQNHDAVQLRMATASDNVEIDEDIVTFFQDYLTEHNEFVRCFKTAREIMSEEQEAARRENRPVREVTLALNARPKERSGYRVAMEDSINYMLDNEFSRECKDFLAAVFVGDFGDISYDTLFVNRNQSDGDTFPRIQGHEVTVDVQSYPLIHLHGERSWSQGSKKNFSDSIREYYAYRIQDRDEVFSPLFSSGKLFSQYLLDACIKIESTKLRYMQENQKILKASNYKTLRGYLIRLAAEIGKLPPIPGSFYILPKTYRQSPRYRQDRFLNGLTLARHFGCPSWFITFTCNPYWSEIQEDLPEGVTWLMRPDIVTRVYQQKKRELLHDLISNQLFGKVAAYMTTDEFQKGSLPHTHILLIMEDEDKPQTSDDVDRFVCAELPDPKDTFYYDLVVQHMLHHRCDKYRIGKIPGCFSNGYSCRFHFPKSLAESTDIDKRRVQYRRRKSKHTATCKVTGHIIDNRNVVPHNEYLMRKYGTHCNVEYSKSTLHSFKYLCVYVNKNPDKTYVSLTDKNKSSKSKFVEWDEIEQYKEMRYLCPTEAMYWIMGWSFGEISHTVTVLPVHREDEDPIIFEEGHEEDAVENWQGSKLTAWFTLNEKDPSFRKYYYTDIPRYCNWIRKEKCWDPKSKPRADNLGRITIVTLSPQTMELFYMRLLLLNVPGATSFVDLRTVEGQVCETYQKACERRGLLQDDNEAFDALEEIATQCIAAVIRYHFALILRHMCPKDPLALWEAFKEVMSEDFAYRAGEEEVGDIHYNLALRHIQDILKSFDLELETFQLPEIDLGLIENYHPLSDQSGCGVEKTFTLQEANEAVASLNDQQSVVFEDILNSVQSNACDKQSLFLILGPGGCGKTYLYNTVIKFASANMIPIEKCAYTGIAAMLLHAGVTSHRLFGIPLVKNAKTVPMSSITTESARAEKLKLAKIIIWDEISMVSTWQIEMVDTFLQLLMKNDLPFGGKVVLMGGDFRQTLPVVKHGSRSDVVKECIVNSKLWPVMKIYELSRNMRAAEDRPFADWLLTLGDGSVNVPGTSRVELDPQHYCSDLDNMIAKVFGDGDPSNNEHAVIVTPLNETMRSVNDIVLSRVPGEARTYLSVNSFDRDVARGPQAGRDDNIIISQEMLQDVDTASLPPHRLTIKIGCIVMLLCNLHVDCGKCNGTRLRVLEMRDKSIKCRILNGANRGDVTFLFRVKLTRTDTELPGSLHRIQFPIRLAYCVTITKSQGSTYDKVGIYLPVPCFTHGQLYVAFSRCRKRKNVFVFIGGRPRAEHGVKKHFGTIKLMWTRNEIYHEVMQAIARHPNRVIL